MRCQAPALFIFHYLRLHSIDLLIGDLNYYSRSIFVQSPGCPDPRLIAKKINSLMDFAPAETPTLVMIIHLDEASELHQILSTPRALFL
jgi:hypothetical protein